MTRSLRILLLGAGLLAGVVGADYHCDPDGDDDAAGSAGQPWRSLAPLAAVDLEPGDRVVLASGATFAGPLRLGADDGGSAERPVVVTASGEEPATIEVASGVGIELDGCGGIVLRRLRVVAPGAGSGDPEDETTRDHHGIRAFVGAGGGRLPPLVLEDLAVSGFVRCGVNLGSWGEEDNPGWDGIRIERVTAVDNGASGIFVFDRPESPGYAHREVELVDCVAGRNRGSGIILCGVDGGRVEFCRAHDNVSEGGNVGIWTYDVRGVTIRHCIAHGTRATGPDGGGFDLDGGTVDTVVERCLSWDNSGPGYMHCDYPTAAPTRGNHIRTNISLDDGRKGDGEPIGAGFVTWGAGLADCHVAGNLVVVTRGLAGKPGGALFTKYLHGYHKQGDVPDVVDSSVRGNHVVLLATGGAAFVVDGLPEGGPQHVRYSANRYRAEHPVEPAVVTGRAQFKHQERAGTAYPSIEAWRTATGQEAEATRTTELDIPDPDSLQLTDPRQLPGLPLLQTLVAAGDE